MKRVSFQLRYALRQRPEDGDNFQPRYQACIDQCAWADHAGFSDVMISEHHGSPDGYMPSPLVLGAAIAAVTKELKFLLGSLVGTVHNPIRLAEDLATLDIVSNGRVLPCISGGYVGSELEMLGTSLSNRKSYMDEIGPFLRNAWSGEAFEWHGRRVMVRPRPVQRPLPIIMGGVSKAAAIRAARFADVFWPPNRDIIPEYYAELERLGKKPQFKMPRRKLVWLTEDPDKFWSEFGPHALHENNAYGKWREESNTFNGYETVENATVLRATGRYPVVTPEDLVSDILADDEEDIAVMLHPMAGGAPPALAWESIKLVESKVMPALKAQGAEIVRRSLIKTGA